VYAAVLSGHSNHRPAHGVEQRVTTTPRYLLDNRSTAAGTRFEALAGVFNDWTFRHIDWLQLPAGAACWEVGAGGPTLPAWLTHHVAPGGSVLATDIDLSWLVGEQPYRVERHDVAADEPPADRFDLVHARLVLTHVPARDEALRHMASTLRPGGWILVEDFDVDLQPLACLAEPGPDEERANRIRRQFVQLLAQRGVDLALGRTLPDRLRRLGLVDVAADAYLPLAVPSTRALELANVTQVRDGLVATGVPADDIEHDLGALRAGTVDIATPPLVSAWGRAPR
jgi:SAM-dependent methyltransferase